jgi:hypothetical protein
LKPQRWEELLRRSRLKTQPCEQLAGRSTLQVSPRLRIAIAMPRISFLHRAIGEAVNLGLFGSRGPKVLLPLRVSKRPNNAGCAPRRADRAVRRRDRTRPSHCVAYLPRPEVFRCQLASTVDDDASGQRSGLCYSTACNRCHMERVRQGYGALLRSPYAVARSHHRRWYRRKSGSCRH